MHNGCVYVAMTVMEITMQEKTMLDAIIFYAYPAKYMLVYVSEFYYISTLNECNSCIT